MTATSTPHRPDPTRTGAVWVTGTGAFLLLAAAAVFTAVQWHAIPDQAKLGAIGLATGSFLIAGRRLASTLPATAGALFHLGAFLVPIDVAAVGVHQGIDWSTMLLAQGVAATVTFWWAARTEESVVLRWAAGAAVVVLAAGIGATTSVPPALVLVAFSVIACVRRQETIALGWAAVAGLAPVLALTERVLLTGGGTIERLGLHPATSPLATAAAAVGAASVIAVIAQRQDRVDLALVSAVVAATGLAAAWTGTDPQPGHTAVGLAATFVLVQLAALAVREDPFWRRPAEVIAGVAEPVAAAALIPLAGLAVLARTFDTGDLSAVMVSVLLAAGWAVAEGRRDETDGLRLPTLAVAIPAVAAVSFSTTSPTALGVAVAAAAMLSMFANRRDAELVTLTGAIAAPLLVWGTAPLAVVVLGVVGSVTIAELAVRSSRRLVPDGTDARSQEEGTWLLAIAAVLPALLAGWDIASRTDHLAAVLIGGAVAATGLAAWLDRGQTSGDLPLGSMARIAAAAVLTGTEALPTEQVAIVAAAVAVLSLLDAVRLRTPVIALGASLAIPVAVGAFVHWRGLSTPSTGVALTIAAVVFAGLGSLIGRSWSVPVAGAVVVSLGGGLLLASGSPTAFADALMITGGVGVAASIAAGRVDALYVSGLVTTAGVWMRLGDAQVASAEPYLVPVAALLLLAGARSRPQASSWVAYGPAIALFGGAALLERTAGGSGWHALVAGAVGVVAVAVGGDRRLAAPLFLGTALLVAVAAYESLDVTASLPTWIWLALGGTTLLGAGVAMERHDVGPIETGRRLVDVVADRFT